MSLWSGLAWNNGEASDAWIRTDGNRVLDRGEGAPPGRGEPYVLLDGLVDHHTHIGDAFLRGRPLPHDVAELVAPGTGLKHRMLATVESPTLVAATRNHLATLASHGTVDVLDFREQGPRGVGLARQAAGGVEGLRVRLLGRPEDPDAPPRDVAELLSTADGLGLPSITDWGRDRCAALAEAAHRRGLPVAIHASEARREPIQDVLALDPDLLVHASAATAADLRAIADAGVPVAVCPTSNHHFGLRPAAAALEEAGIPWFLGTDNAMLGGADLVAEARLLATTQSIPDASLLRALTTRPETSIRRLHGEAHRSGAAPRLVALPLDALGRVQWNATPRVLEA